MRSVSLIPLAILLTPLAAPAAWETVTHDGRDYVTARSIRNFYKFESLEQKGDYLVLENKALKCRLKVGDREVFMNNIKYLFSFPIIAHEERFLVSRIDLAKLIDPVFRPHFFTPAAPLDTVIIDPERPPRDNDNPDPVGAIASFAATELGSKKRFKTSVITRKLKEPLAVEKRLKLINGTETALLIGLRVVDDATQAEGIRTWVVAPQGASGEGDAPRDSDGQKCTGNHHDALNIAVASAVHSSLLLKTGRPDRGIARSRDPLLTGAQHPAVIVEIGNLAHPGVVKLLASEAFQRTTGEAIATGLMKFDRAVSRGIAAEKGAP